MSIIICIFAKPNFTIIMKLFRNTIIILTILFTSNIAYSQAFQGALALGANLTQVDGDEMYGFKKFGFNAAAVAIMPFKKNWAFSIEASYTQKGSYEKYPNVQNPLKELPYYNLRLSYAEVPFLVHYTDKEFLTVGLGMAWGRLVELKEIEWGLNTGATIYSGEYSRDDISGIFDLRFPVYKGLNINFRYSYSFAKIRHREYFNISGDTWKRKQYNNVLTLRLYYIFNERKNRSND